MNEFTSQRIKTVVLACAIAGLQLPGLFITQHLHGSRYLPAFVVCWALAVAVLLVYTIVQFMKLMKMKRGYGQ